MIEWECYDCQTSFMTLDDEIYKICPFCGGSDFYTLDEEDNQ